MWFIFFPLAILIPFLVISLLIRFLRIINYRRISNAHPLRPRGFLNLLPVGRNPGKRVSSEEFEVYVYRLAVKKKGRLTPAYIVVDSGLSMTEVEKRMNSLIDHVHIFMEVEDSGRVVYEFPEFFPENG